MRVDATPSVSRGADAGSPGGISTFKRLKQNTFPHAVSLYELLTRFLLRWWRPNLEPPIVVRHIDMAIRQFDAATVRDRLPIHILQEAA